MWVTSMQNSKLQTLLVSKLKISITKSTASRPLCYVMSLLWLVGGKCDLSNLYDAHSSREQHCHVLSNGEKGHRQFMKVCVCPVVDDWNTLLSELLDGCTSDNRCGAAFVAVCSSLSSSVFGLLKLSLHLFLLLLCLILPSGNSFLLVTYIFVWK